MSQANPVRADLHERVNGVLDNSRRHEEFMSLATVEAMRGVQNGEGGPFGAIVVHDNRVISRGHNRVLQTNDPTSHAEVVAIREACAKLGRFSLHDCVMYATCEPCPMCYGAIHWSRIPTCYFGSKKEEAANIGFDDVFILEALKAGNSDRCEMKELRHSSIKQVFDLYARKVGDGETSLY